MLCNVMSIQKAYLLRVVLRGNLLARCATTAMTCKLDQAIETNVGGWTVKGFGGTLSTRMESFCRVLITFFL